MRLLVLTACLLLLTDARTAAEKETMQKAIRMKTSRQLKEIFDELGIDHKGLDKDALRKKAYKEDAVGRWEELHPDKKPKPRSAPGGGGGSGGGGMPDFGGKAPEGYDQAAWEKLMAQMRGDFSHEKASRRRRSPALPRPGAPLRRSHAPRRTRRGDESSRSSRRRACPSEGRATWTSSSCATWRR